MGEPRRRPGLREQRLPAPAPVAMGARPDPHAGREEPLPQPPLRREGAAIRIWESKEGATTEREANERVARW